MPAKKSVTTKRGQYHKFRSFRINLVKDGTLEKIDSNILRNKPEMFEKKKVTFEKRNADPSYFTETLRSEFPSLQGNQFSLWRLGCTNAPGETKTSLIPLPNEINNAVALCECEELNRSCLYIKFWAAPDAHPVPSSPGISSDSGDGDDSTPPPSSPRRISTVPDLLPTENNQLRFLSSQPSTPIVTFDETSKNSNELQIESLATQPLITFSASDTNQPILIPLGTSVSSSQEPYAAQYYITNILDMPPKVQVSSTQDTENRHPKKRKYHNVNNFEPMPYTVVSSSQTNDTNEVEEKQNSQFMSLDQQGTTFSYTALLGDHTLTSEIAHQAGTMDINYPHHIYLNPPMFADLPDSANLQVMSGHNDSFGEPFIASSLPSLPYNAAGPSGLQDSAQQLSAVNSISTNEHSSWDRVTHMPVQETNRVRTDVSEVIATNEDSKTILITKYMEFLIDRMDPDFGLLDFLIASKDLTMAEFHKIRSQPSTIEDRNQKLLQYIIEKNKGKTLIEALEKARQLHLVNFLNSDGIEDEYCDVWPLSTNELDMLTTNRQVLMDGLYSADLSYKLLFKDVVNKRQHEFILSKPTNSEKSEALLEILRRGSIEQYNQTIESLRELKQDHILKVLQKTSSEVDSASDTGRNTVDQAYPLTQSPARGPCTGSEGSASAEDKPHQLEGGSVTGMKQSTAMLMSPEMQEQLLFRQMLTPHNLQLFQRNLLLKQNRGEDMRPNEPDPIDLQLESGQGQDVPRQTNDDEIPEKYKLDPALIHTIETNPQEDEKIAIMGLAILGKELFVASHKRSDVKVHDLINFSFCRRLILKELHDPRDMASCKTNRCLYINNYKTSPCSEEILRVDANGNLIKNWLTGNDNGFGLSVTDESNVILSFYNRHKLYEYSPDGQLIHTIDLLSWAGIRYPCHAIKLTSGDYMVCHGDGRSLNRVCLVDTNGKLKESFGRNPGCAMDEVDGPRHLAIDGNGFVMVADSNNDRVLLLNSDLTFKKIVILLNGTHESLQPFRILLDKSNGLIVTSNQSSQEGRIFLFKLKQ